MTAAIRDNTLEVAHHSDEGGVGGLQLRERDHRLERPSDRLRPRTHLVTIAHGDTEQLTDHLKRERERKIGDQLEPARGQRVVDHIVDNGLHPRPPRVDRLGRERAGGESPQASMRRRVEVQHRAVAKRDRGRRNLFAGEQASVGITEMALDVGRRMRAAQDLRAVFVAREHE